MDASWPEVDETALTQDSILIVLQVNGKLRDKIVVSKDMSKEDLEQIALDNEAVKRFSDGKTLQKVIVVPSRLVNVVVS